MSFVSSKMDRFAGWGNLSWREMSLAFASRDFLILI
jgi:hypothetical protein